MSDDIQYRASWPEEKTQCKNCESYQKKDKRHACVPKDKTFEEAIAEYGEVSPAGHCNYFEAR